MKRRPIFIGVTAVLALALTAGLAYGAGRLVGTQGRNARMAGYGQSATTSMVPGSFSNHRGRVFDGFGYDSAFMSQMRGWMRDWMRDHRSYGRSWTGASQGRQASGPSPHGASTGSSGGTDHGYWDDHQTTSGHQNGPGTGMYGSGGNHHDGHGWDYCW